MRNFLPSPVYAGIVPEKLGDQVNVMIEVLVFDMSFELGFADIWRFPPITDLPAGHGTSIQRESFAQEPGSCLATLAGGVSPC